MMSQDPANKTPTPIDTVIPFPPIAQEEETAPIQKVEEYPPSSPKIITIPIRGNIPPPPTEEDSEEANPEEEEKELEELEEGDEEEDLIRRPIGYKKPAPPPDLPPNQLARNFAQGLSLLRLRYILVFLPVILLSVMALSPLLGYTLPSPWDGNLQLQCFGSALLLGTCMLLGCDILFKGLKDFVLFRSGGETLVTLACIFSLADALTMSQYNPLRLELPYCAVSALSLLLAMYGTYTKREGLRLACRAISSRAEPYLITLDDPTGKNSYTYVKWEGAPIGFGSQVQEPDGCQKAYSIAAPLLIVGCVVLSFVSSYGREVPNHLLWCLSATTSSVASLSCLCVFGPPFLKLARRLFPQSAAIAGWSGVTQKGDAISLTDSDLFPPGTVTINGVKVFGNVPLDKVVSVTASLLRSSDCGIQHLFEDLSHSHGGTYRPISGELTRYESGGFSAAIRGQHIVVGTSNLMAELQISLPAGLDLKNTLFCAIDGELAGMYGLHYRISPSVSPNIYTLLTNQIPPVLATRDCNIKPGMLHQRFKLPSKEMQFPPVEERTLLSDPEQLHNPRITAVLCLDTVTAYTDAVVGSKRLRTAVLLSTAFSIAGAVLGLLLSYFITAQGAYSSITVANLLIFQLAWLVPTFFITSWVNGY